MPLGDPGGGNFEYTTEGLPISAAFIEIPVRDIERAVRFYRDILGFSVSSQSGGTAVMGLNGECKVVLISDPKNAGRDTGLYLKVDNPFDFNRRMVDEGVIMTKHPQKGPLGVSASFRDDDGNILHVIS
jgi:catechol 2,3-dioxygenase-like lactoylglutathione lyase family enzyme